MVSSGKDGIPEPEDHLGSLCEMMAGMITGGFGQVMPLQSQRIFQCTLPRGNGHCFNDLEKAESAVLYAPVGSLGRLLMEIEQESFRIDNREATKCESTTKEMFMSEQKINQAGRRTRSL